MIPRPPRSTLFPTRRSSDLVRADVPERARAVGAERLEERRLGLDRDRARGDGVDDAAAERDDVAVELLGQPLDDGVEADRKSTRLNSSHMSISYAVFCLKKK